MRGPLTEGEPCLLVDNRGRRYLIDLRPGGSFQFHAGAVAHDDLIGSPAGTVVWTEAGARLVALRPRLADYVLKMDRGAQVVYPKDLGPIIHWADVAPGHTVVEAGTGSGALTMALWRAVGPEGRVVSVDRRSDHLEHARKTITRFLGEIPGNLDVIEGIVEDVLPAHTPDRVLLDLPEPWSAVEPAADALAAGGLLCTYLPTVPQLQKLHEELRISRRFVGVESFEIMLREWQVDGRSVRPMSQMVGHTGFITVAHVTVERLDRDPA
ncbi:MAG TPA: tRNA (adenine-N1)-methyltransferase [Acidimicrobiia bacterium]|nr:tRNA (adenine-N1)-methyltransferase [Acidimicrobiia bacterium]